MALRAKSQAFAEDTALRHFLPNATFQSEEVAEEAIAGLQQDPLQVILHGFEHVLVVPHPHYRLAILRRGGDGDVVGNGADVGAERVVVCGCEALQGSP